MLQRYDKLPIRLVWSVVAKGEKSWLGGGWRCLGKQRGVSMQKKGGCMVSFRRGLLWVALETYCGSP